ISDCGAIDPKCKYYGEQSFTIAAPLVANFTYGGTCGPNDLYQPITFASSTTGGNTPYQYSWEVRDAVTNVVLATSTTNPYTYTPQSSNNLSVKLTVTDASTSQQSDNETKIVTVTSCCESPTVSSNPQNQVKCQGTSASFSVGYTGGNPVPGIQWQYSTDGGLNWANVPNSAPYSGGTTGTLNISSVTLAMNNYQYKAILKSGMCAAVESNSATLTVDPTSVGGTVSAAQTICYGNQLNSNLTLSGNTGLILKWQRSTDNFVSNSTDIANTTTTLTAATIGALTQDTWFRAVVKSGQCAETNSSAVKITVNALSVAGTIASAQTICYGNQPSSNLTLSGNTGSVLKWQRSTDNFVSNTTDIANTTTTLTAAAIGALTQDTWFRVIVKNGECPDITSAAIKITVNAISVGGSVASNQTICSGNQPNSNLLLSGHTGSVVKWQKSTTSNFSAGSTTDIANTTTTLSAASIGALTADTWFRVVVKNGVCSETTSDAVKITVQQPISNNTIAASQVICSGNAPNGLTGSTPTGGDGNYTYQWQSRSGGGWSNIEGATDKDYAPGSLSQNTEFRRIVTAGSACSNNSSAAVTISMSPESQVYPIQGSSFCQSAPNTGMVTLLDSYNGVSYQLKKASDNSDVQPAQIGTGAALIWTGLEAGTYYVLGTGLAPTFCPSQTANVVVRMFDCSVFYTLTQGYYGGKNGKSCIGATPVNTIKYLLGDVDLVVGTTNSITVPATNEGAIKLNQTLPGGGTANALPAGNCIITTGCFVSPTYLTQQGRINNILLSQTITLSLNVRWDEGKLLLFPIKNGYLTTQKMKGCGENAILVEVCESGTVSSILMNANVVTYLGPDATVADLLQLANDVLGGTKTPGVDGVPSYADVNAAVDCINKSFDEGRRFLNYFETQQTCEMLFPTPALPAGTITTTLVSAYREPIEPITVTAYPNPFSDNINFQIETKQSGQGVLEVYNMTGQKVKTVFQGYMNAGRQRFSMTLPPGKSAVLFYVFRLGNQKASGKLFQSASR
ncbi:MAG TPA: T9SS type A sorting domain-containing protein, partial [Chitinophagaceae bacterium]